MSSIDEAKSRTLTIERIIQAPIQLVWEAWSQPQHIVEWWGPQGMQTEVKEHNFQVGGSWQYLMQMPDGREFMAEGVYVEIVALQRIITSANFKPMTEGVELQVLFREMGAQTQFTFNVVHPTEEYCKQQEEMGFYNGWGSVFDRLVEYLQKEKL